MPIARVRGVDLYYEDVGAGDVPLVVAHGLMGSVSRNHLSGVDVSALAARGFRVIAVDARGHGRSGYTREPRTYTWRALSDDLVALLDHLGLQQVSILGTSMGAGTGLWIAAQHPQRVSALVMKAPGPLDVHMAPTRWVMGALLCAYGCAGGQATAWMFSRFSRERERVLDRLRSQRAAAMVPAIRGLVFSSDQIHTGLVDSVVAPTLLVGHRGDALHPERSLLEYHRRLRGSQLLMAKHSTYWRERGAELADRVAEFVLHRRDLRSGDAIPR